MGTAGRRSALALAVAAAFAAAACQGILGVEDWTSKATKDSGAPASCLLSSECSGTDVCLFKTCSPPCAGDKDCGPDRYCLKTADDLACVSSAQAKCANAGCPTGTVCAVDGRCVTSCAMGVECPGGQECVADQCVSRPSDAGINAGGAGNGGAPNGGAGVGVSGRDSGSPVAGAGGIDSGILGTDSGTDSGAGGAGDGTAVGTVDAKCPKGGDLACSGHAARGELTCESGKWTSSGTCSSNTLCDTTPGANAGSCQPMVAECVGQAAGFRFCRAGDADVRECGIDLVTEAVVDTCQYVCTDGACVGECHPGDVQCKPGGTTVPELCDATGKWQDQTACSYLCDPSSGKCLAPGCGDGVQNGTETDKDCGGACTGCKVAQRCGGNADCVLPDSGKCVTGKCVAASCTDGVENGKETDKDCGGPGCTAKCLPSQGCQSDPDCKLPDSGHCSAGRCVAAACNDNIKNGDETDTDCGGACSAACPLGDGCKLDVDCASGVCIAGACAACLPGSKKCLGAAVQTCSAAGDWGSAAPCTLANTTASCAAGACVLGPCTSGYANCDSVTSNGCETNLDSVATCGKTCATQVCSSAHGTPSCANGACGTSSCAAGYADCKSVSNDGCETNLHSVATCGASCGTVVACSLAHATAACPAGSCTIGGCNTGYGNCDGQAATGCEINLWQAGACGTTCVNRVACSQAHGTAACTSGTCTMSSCGAGYGDCGGSNDGCETNLGSIASCGASCANKTICGAGQICTGGQCVTNNPYNVGNAAPTGWPAFDAPDDNWYVVSIQPPRDATLVAMRFVASAAGGFARMAIWSDQGGPGAFIAQTANISVAAGVNSGASAPANTTLNGGQKYWIGAVFTGGGHIYQNYSPGAVVYNYPAAFANNPATTLAPFPLGSASTITDVSLSLFVVVEDIPK